MLQFLYPGRAYKRLLYAVLVWTCVCFFAFRVSFNGERVPSSWNAYLTGSDHNRGLLANNDYPAFAAVTTGSPSVSVDTSSPPSEQQLLVSLSNASNLPLVYWSRHISSSKAAKVKGSCQVEFPSLFELRFNNVYWQHFASSNGSFFLYGAYFDDRWRGGPLAMVRILAMVDRISPPPVACQLWYENVSQPITASATYVYGWYPKWGNYVDGPLQPFIITCKIPRIKGLERGRAPTSVSVVENKCDSVTNNLRVLNDRPAKKQRFAVCVKGLDFLFEDMSVRLVEWLELLRLLGAAKVFLYDLEVHPNISKVLDHYRRQGLVEVTKITLPGSQPNLPGFRHLYLKKKLTFKRQNELIPYNDCLYRNLYSFEYLALLDIDEIIMPLKHSNWADMMDEVLRVSLQEKNYTRASYNFRNVYFLDDQGSDEPAKHTGHEPGIPSYLHMLQHVYRSQNYTKPGQYVKCFHNTERVVSQVSVSTDLIFSLSCLTAPRSSQSRCQRLSTHITALHSSLRSLSTIISR